MFFPTFLLSFPSSIGAFAALTQTAQESGLKFDFPQLVTPGLEYQNLLAVPTACASYTGAGKECPGTMDAINITFEDCGSPWTVCRCSTADISGEETIDFLGRVPIGLRRYMGTVMVMPGGTAGAHAYTFPTSGEVHFFGNCSQRTWIHEATHAADGSLGITADSVGGAWAQALAKDTCVPDTYAQSNAVEDLAQMSVVKIYMLLNNGQLPPGFEAACMTNQLAVLDGLALYDSGTMLGKTCAFEPAAHHDLAPSLFSTNSSSGSSPSTPSTNSGSPTSESTSPSVPNPTSSNGAIRRDIKLPKMVGFIAILATVL
ncbi:hypothetical protein C8J56DRAFT_952527 [Mycena floridula]|nr:hypothetical protein C8J56DRAFT_952527 [Mycena floridula]